MSSSLSLIHSSRTFVFPSRICDFFPFVTLGSFFLIQTSTEALSGYSNPIQAFMKRYFHLSA